MNQPRLPLFSFIAAVALTTGCSGGEDSVTVSPSPLAASCVETYSPANLAHRAFAFDGTISAVGLREDPKLPQHEGETSGVRWVTFSVNRWYKGGFASEVRVWLDFLNSASSVGTIEGERGTRLLVAGEPRWGGQPLDDPIAWACGFTRAYTGEAAAEWQRALSP